MKYGHSGSFVCFSSSNVYDGTVGQWISRQCRDLCVVYESYEMFNAEETWFLYDMAWNRPLKYRRENCFGRKTRKTRVTIMVAANMTGYSKRKLLVVGKSRKLSYF